MFKGKGYAELRKGRYSEVEFAYHLVFSTAKREPVFADFYRARYLIGLLKKCEQQGFAQTMAFVVMPDHVHWLFELKEGSVSGLIQRVKSFYTKNEGRNIWNKGFYDHAIRTDEDLTAVARYIVANPLRAGLVKRVGDYPHWDAVWL